MLTKAKAIVLEEIYIRSSGNVKLTGSGSGVDIGNQINSVNKITKGEGIKLISSSINSVSPSGIIELIGSGGESDDQINSQTILESS